VLYDAELREITGPRGRVRLTITQHRMIELLMRRPGRLVSRDAMMDRLYGDRVDNPPEVRAVDVGIWRLRAALQRAGVTNAIETVRSTGWVWRPPGST
jgi:two-component system phosphate regulon response regulator PhoB